MRCNVDYEDLISLRRIRNFEARNYRASRQKFDHVFVIFPYFRSFCPQTRPRKIEYFQRRFPRDLYKTAGQTRKQGKVSSGTRPKRPTIEEIYESIANWPSNNKLMCDVNY